MSRSVVAVVLAVVVLALAFPGLAPASIAFDEHTGTGTVDRTDVQTAFGWSNAQLGQMKHEVVFTVVNFEAAQYLCTSGAELVTVGRRDTAVITSKWQGEFVLSGYAGPFTLDQPFPQAGDPCPNGDGSTIVREDGGDSNPGNLFATVGGESVYLGTFLP